MSTTDFGAGGGAGYFGGGGGSTTGKAGGGGIPGHLHVHILPRWNGDTNFLTTLGETRLICSDFHDIYNELKEAFDAIEC